MERIRNSTIAVWLFALFAYVGLAFTVTKDNTIIIYEKCRITIGILKDDFLRGTL